MYWLSTSTGSPGVAWRRSSAARSPSSVWVGGIRTSVTTMSGRVSATAVSSESASPTAAATSWPKRASTPVSPSRSSGLSSAITARRDRVTCRCLRWVPDPTRSQGSSRPAARTPRYGWAVRYGRAAAVTRTRPPRRPPPGPAARPARPRPAGPHRRRRCPAPGPRPVRTARTRSPAAPPWPARRGPCRS